MTGQQSLWTKDFTLTMIVNCIAFFGVQLLFPILPVFSTELGGKPSEVGLIIGIFTFGAVVSRPFAVRISKRWGRQKVVFLGMALSAIGIGSCYFSSSVAWLLLPRFIHGLGFGVITTMFAGVVSDMVPNHRQGEGIGYLGLGVSLSMTIAPFLGIEIFKNYGSFTVFTLSTMSQIFAFFVLFAISSETWKFKTIVSKKENSKSTSVWTKRLILPCILAALFGMANSSQSFLMIYGGEAGFTKVGELFVLSAIAVSLIRLVSGKIFDTRGAFWIFFPGAFCLAIYFYILWSGTNEWLFLGSGILYGIGSGALFPALQAWFVTRSFESQRTGANAAFYNAFDIGVSSGIVLLGYIAELSNYREMYGFAGISMAVFLGILFLVKTIEWKWRKVL